MVYKKNFLTEQKQAENKLERTEKRLRAAWAGTGPLENQKQMVRVFGAAHGTQMELDAVWEAGLPRTCTCACLLLPWGPPLWGSRASQLQNLGPGPFGEARARKLGSPGADSPL